MTVLFSFCALVAAVTAYPDYLGITLPPNIAPLNFDVKGTEGRVRAEYAAADGETLAAEGPEVRFAPRPWRAFLARHVGEDVRVTVSDARGARLVATNRIARTPMDGYLVYRLVVPSYRSFGPLGIWQRDLATFASRPVYRNVQVDERQCVNCHTPKAADPNAYLFQLRAVDPGTVIVSEKYGKRRVCPVLNGLNAVYPAWHPSGDFVAFSHNETRQLFHLTDVDKVEVFDRRSDLSVYSLADNRCLAVETNETVLSCYPAWSPDGRRLYCSTAERVEDVRDVRYDLTVRDFDPAKGTCSAPRRIFDARSEKASATLPRASPDGRWLVFAVGPCGCFHIWHRAADLAIMDLRDGRVRRLDELNSPEAESYHTFSSDGRWMVFSSRRDDGVHTRPYFAFFDAERGVFAKPFLLPAEDPAEHARQFRSYNIPEFLKGPIRESPAELKAVGRDAR